MTSKTRSPSPLSLALLAALSLSLACAHTPTEQEREEAVAEYKAGLALVHEAQRAAVEGDAVKQDLKYRLALESLLKANKLDGENAEVNYLLGLVYFSGFKRHADAEKHLRRALASRQDDYPEADNLLGSVLVDGGRPAEALPHFERARSNLLYKTPYFSEQELGWAKYKLGRLDEAAAHLRNALVAQPDLCGGYIKLAEVEEARQKPEVVAEVLADFLERCDSDRLRAQCGPALLAWGYYRFGMTKLKAGELDAAASALQTCTARFSGEPVAEECDRSLKLMQ
jgi:tetratricopeptide (TPR) repeat protein